MNEKEMNLAILKELRKIAGKVFAKVTVSKEGTYTAAELWNEKDAFCESIVIDYKGTESEIYTAEIGTFKMQITPQKLWYVLWKFEKLCNVKQSDKIRFTYGKQEGENISEKAMYLDKSGKEVTRKKSLVKLSERVAIEPDKKSKKYNLYYYFSDIWYLMVRYYDESQYKAIKGRIDKDSDYIFMLLQKWDFESESEFSPIYKDLYESMKSERANSTPEQRKSENEPKNTVICEVVTGRTNDGVLRVEQKELKSIGNSLYKDDKDIYFWYGIYCYCIGAYTRGVAAFLKEQGNNIRAKIREMIEQGGITTESANILYREMCKKDAAVKPESAQGTNEDYPPEPYNKEKSENVASLATFKTRNVATFDAGNVATSGKRMKARTICGHSEKSANSCGNGRHVLPGYFRQKVFPTELFCAGRKIRRYKPRYFIVYTNYHLRKENALERKRNGNTSVYRALIRGKTKNNILICR